MHYTTNLLDALTIYPTGIVATAVLSQLRQDINAFINSVHLDSASPPIPLSAHDLPISSSLCFVNPCTYRLSEYRPPFTARCRGRSAGAKSILVIPIRRFRFLCFGQDLDHEPFPNNCGADLCCRDPRLRCKRLLSLWPCRPTEIAIALAVSFRHRMTI